MKAERQIHALVQGSPEWQQFRLEHDGASEAAAMLGLSKNVTRTELLRAKHTGIAREFSDFVQTRILDHGHEVEALARPLLEAVIGEELYPVTYSFGRLSASTDGLTMGGEVAAEHKQWAKELAESVARGVLPEGHQPQCQQVLLVTNAARLIFGVSDGTPDNFVHMEVLPDHDWFRRIIAGWKQFHIDLENYQHVEAAPATVAAPVMALPALSIVVNGSITLIDNLKTFGEQLGVFIANIDKNPSSDQAFADAEAAVKTLQSAQDALEAAERNALAQTADIDTMRRTVALYAEQARNTRLMLEKLVKARKESIRVEIVLGGRTAFADHLRGLNTKIGGNYMPAITENFAGVIKGKKTITSLRDACDTELARLKIAANEIAINIQTNLATLRELASDHKFLFADVMTIILKAPDDLRALVTVRISEHKVAEAKRIEAERERIREEELARIAAEKKSADERAAAPDTSVTLGVTSPPVAQAAAGPLVPTAPKPAVKLTAHGIRPADDAIIGLLALHYRVHESKVIEWLLMMDLTAASERMAREFS